jgi:signal transduction histidine kinase
LFATGFALALTAALHHAAFAWKPVWVGIAEHLYAIPILWAAIRHEWRGGLVAGVLSVAAVAWAASESNPEIRLALLLESSVFLLLGPASGWLVANWRKSVGQMKDLESQLNDRNRILAQAGKLSAAGELAMGLAHELRHPAATIRGISDLLKDPCLQPELRVECLSILERECSRIERLLSDLLHFSRPRIPEIGRVCPHQAVDSAIALARYSSGDSRIEWRKRIDPGLPYLVCDPEQLKQVLLNLLLNAVQAMPDGGGITVDVSRDKGNAIILVVDEGRGIAPELMDKIFLPFVTSRPEGAGLGLTLAKQLVVQHGGDLSARRNRGPGMTFRISLPLTEAPRR